MEKGNFVYSGWRANGFVALVGLLVLIAGGIALCVFGSDVMDPRIGLRTAMLVCGVCLFFISMFCFKGFMLLEPNEARVVMFFGKYKGTFYETGFWWINPFMGRKKISVRARNLNVEPIKVNDKNGNPVMIGLVLGMIRKALNDDNMSQVAILSLNLKGMNKQPGFQPGQTVGMGQRPGQ